MLVLIVCKFAYREVSKMLATGPAIVAFVNAAGGGHRDRLIERFALAAMSDTQLLAMNPDELQNALFASFAAYAVDQGMISVTDSAATRRALCEALCSEHVIFRHAAISSDRNVARIGRSIAEAHLNAGRTIFNPKTTRRNVIRRALNDHWEQCYGGRLPAAECDEFASLVLERLSRMALGVETVVRIKTFEQQCSKMPYQEFWGAFIFVFNRIIDSPRPVAYKDLLQAQCNTSVGLSAFSTRLGFEAAYVGLQGCFNTRVRYW
jgi:hypothetical protein